MKRKTSALAAAIALAIGATQATPVAAAPATPQAQAACTNAKIGGQRRCIQSGQFCARAYERDYNRAGYSCSKRDRNGRYHLVRR
jgi:hypothetical protein